MADWPVAQSGGAAAIATEFGGPTVYATPLAATGVANAKGAWVEAHPALPWDVAGFLFQTVNNSANAQHLFDMGIGAASSEVVLLPNFVAGPSTASHLGFSQWYPVRIAKGKRVAFRHQSDSTTATAGLSAVWVPAGFAADPGFSRIVDLGTDLALTGGAAVDPGGSANTKGSWATIGTAAHALRSIVVLVSQNNATTTNALWRLDIGVGSGPTVILPDIILRSSADVDNLMQTSFGPFPISIPAGVSVSARASCTTTDATDRLLNDIIIHGMD